MNRTYLVFCSIWALMAVACTGSDSGGFALDVAPELAPGPDLRPDIHRPECDPEAAPSGCAEGSLCWFGRCVPVTPATLAEPDEGLVAAVASLAPAARLGLVAVTGHSVESGEQGLPAARSDAIGIYRVDAQGFGPYEELRRWAITGNLSRPAPAVQLVRGESGEPIVVEGPVSLRAHQWDGAQWVSSEALDTGARQYGSEGTFAAVVDAQGALHVAYRDVQSERLEIATLGESGGWSVQTVREGLDGWGSLVVGTRAGARVVFAHIYAEEEAPTVVRWALVVEQEGEGWRISEPSLGDGLAIRGRIMGFDAATDDRGRLSLGWISASRRFGLAVRGEDGSWLTDDSHLSERAVWDDLNGNLRLRWWQDSAVLVWLGYAEWECDCFDLRMAMHLGETWQEQRVDRFEGMSAGGLGLDLSPDGELLLTVGGGVEVVRGLSAPRTYRMPLPDWQADSAEGSL